MNILYYNPVGSIGGAEVCLLDLLAVTGRVRPDWQRVVVLGDDGPLRARVEALGIRCRVEPMPRSVSRLGDASSGGGPRLLGSLTLAAPALIAYRARLARVFRAEAPDLIQTNGMKAHLLGTLASPRGVPLVWHLHDYLQARPVMSRLLRLVSRSKEVAVVAVSRSVTDDARAVFGPDVAIHAVHNAVDLEVFHPGPDVQAGVELDRLAGLPSAPAGTVRVGLVATYARWKGHAVFFEAIARIPRDRPARFYVVGGPIYRSTGSQWSHGDLLLEAAARGVVDRLGFVGLVDDPARGFRGLDVVVHASTRPEPFGRVIVEGMATGRAVVAIQGGGSSEVFVDEETALGCPPDDPEALARAIDRLIGDPGLRDALGQRARQAAVGRFDRDQLFEKWGPIYAGLSPTAPSAQTSSQTQKCRGDAEVLNSHGR